MDRYYSILEFVKHDATVKIPERDYDTTIFEFDVSVLIFKINKISYMIKNCDFY